MVALLVDVDDPIAHAEKIPAREAWRLLERQKVSRLFEEQPGGFSYETKGGYRLLYRLGEHFLLRREVDAHSWRLFYFRALCHLAERYELVGDPACSDWTRLYRLPRATREGNDAAELRPTHGDPSNVGLWTYQHTEEGLQGDREVAARLVVPFPAWERVVKDLAPVVPTPKKDTQPRPKTTHGDPDPDGLTPYLRATLESAVQKLRNSPPGGRNNLFNQEVYSLAGLEIDRSLLEAELGAAARVAGLVEKEIRATFESAFKAGAAQPRTIEPPRSAHKAPNTPTGGEVPGLPALEVSPVAPKAPSRTWDEFMALKPKPRESLCGQWFRTGALVMVSGDSGAGKTWFCLDFAISVATGVAFMGRWSVPKARKVLIVSGEDDIDDLQKRGQLLLTAKSKAAGKKLSPLINFLNTHDLDLLPNGLPNLGTPEGRAKVEAALEGVELVILDNYGVLFNGVDENDAKEFAPAQDWLFWFKTRGISVLLLSQTGKNGDHRGSSKKVDGLNATILLNHPTHWKARDGASFSLRFIKSRDARGSEVDSFTAQLGEDEDGDLCWLFDVPPPTLPASTKPDSKTAEILELHSQGKTPKEIIEAGYSKPTVYRVLSSLKNSTPTKAPGASRVSVSVSHPPKGVGETETETNYPLPRAESQSQSHQSRETETETNYPLPRAESQSHQSTKPESHETETERQALSAVPFPTGNGKRETGLGNPGSQPPANPPGDPRLSDEELRIGVELERQFKEQGNPNPDRAAYDELMRRRKR